MAVIKPYLPYINTGNPISKGLVCDLPFYERSGPTAANIASRFNKGTLTNGPVWSNSIYGTSITFDSSNDLISVPNYTAINNLSTFTYESLAYASDTSVARRVFDRNGQWSVLYTNGSGGKCDISTNGVASTNPTATSSGTPAYMDRLNHIVMTYDDIGDRTPDLFINGVEPSYSSHIAAIGSISAVTNDIIIGNRSDTGRPMNGPMVYFRVWNRVLTFNEIKELYTNPFCIYKTPKLTFFNSLSNSWPGYYFGGWS